MPVTRATAWPTRLRRVCASWATRYQRGTGRRSGTASRLVREALKSDDINRIRRLTEEVQQASHALSQQMYAQKGPAGPETGAGPTTEGGPSGEQGDVVEGEFREA